MEGIGIVLDLKWERMFVTDLGGSIIRPNSTDRIRRHYSMRRGTYPA